MQSLADPQLTQSILDRLAKVRPDRPARWGRMSAPQMVCHLADSFRGTMGEKPVSPASGLFQRTVMKWFALYVPLRWPKGVPTRPEMDQFAGGTSPVEFECDREELIGITRRFCAPDRALEGQSHPLFGAMSREEWMRWAYLHMDHHLRQFGV